MADPHGSAADEPGYRGAAQALDVSAGPIGDSPALTAPTALTPACIRRWAIWPFGNSAILAGPIGDSPALTALTALTSAAGASREFPAGNAENAYNSQALELVVF